MPNWNSPDGKWYPAKEKVGLIDEKGQPYIYEGPDRAALEVLKAEGHPPDGFLGEDFRDNADSIEVAAKFNCASPEEYARKRGWKPEVAKVKAEEASKVVNLHEAPKKGRGVRPRGGASTIEGGFGETPAV